MRFRWAPSWPISTSYAPGSEGQFRDRHATRCPRRSLGTAARPFCSYPDPDPTASVLLQHGAFRNHLRRAREGREGPGPAAAVWAPGRPRVAVAGPEPFPRLLLRSPRRVALPRDRSPVATACLLPGTRAQGKLFSRPHLGKPRSAARPARPRAGETPPVNAASRGQRASRPSGEGPQREAGFLGQASLRRQLSGSLLSLRASQLQRRPLHTARKHLRRSTNC